MDSSSVASYFAEINTLANLQFWPGQKPYIDRPTAATRPKDLLLYLGCNVLRTANLVLTVIDVLKAMDFDFNAVGGPAHCCGNVHHLANHPERAHAVAEHSLRRLADHGATQVLIWCPSCIAHYDEVVTKERDVGLSYEHVSAFIARHLERIRFAKRIEKRVAIHGHSDHPQSESDSRNVRRILTAIPGLEVVELETPPAPGRHCSQKWIQEMGWPNWRTSTTAMLDAARDARIDVVANVYHSCQREICQEEAKYAFSIVHYITLLGEAMGIEYADAYKALKLQADPDAAFHEVEACARANRLDPARVRWVLRKTFAPAREGDGSNLS